MIYIIDTACSLLLRGLRSLTQSLDGEMDYT